MVGGIEVALIALALVLAAYSALMTVLKRPVHLDQLIGAGVAEVALLGQAVLAVVKLAQGERPDGGTLLFVLYLVGSVLLVPIATLWGRADRSRWGSGVMVVGYLVMAVLMVRMQQIWQGPHA
jgi:hypothetical protein